MPHKNGKHSTPTTKRRQICHNRTKQEKLQRKTNIKNIFLYFLYIFLRLCKIFKKYPYSCSSFEL